MAEINNFSEITENFDTIKTLLNSIRAQGILNTSDVDKLLSGINAKLEKLNTEEDIDLIKIFLSELKQNLDERHNTLVSKFGAIESLFSNLLKNSADALKSSEVKELFDIVATNLSVFSREVVSQKETLTDITLRLDSMRSDESQKKEIIKNISLLKNDLDKLNNGFDSIVLSLNENFKTLIKTLSSIDQTETLNKFEGNLNDVVNSSNTILSALQMLDKKNVQIEDLIGTLATAEDIIGAKRQISELIVQNKEISSSVENLSAKTIKIDNLAEKIDASVSIIAGLKTVISDANEESKHSILNKLTVLEASLKEISTDTAFEEFKSGLENVLKDISQTSNGLRDILLTTTSDINKINDNIKALDINTSFKNLSAEIAQSEHDVKAQIDVASDKISQLMEVGIARTINNISSGAETLASEIKETNHVISDLCKKNFFEVIDNISGLKRVVAQIDENNVSANNAIFSNITDRLAIFENSLKSSLEKQEDYVANSSNQLVEQISALKDLSGVMDYKLDSSLIEINNAKKEYEELKNSVKNVLALDFVNVVKDLRVDLYASKQELSNAIDTTSTDLSDKLSNDLFGKYELLISKLDYIEDNFKKVQSTSLANLKSVLDGISSSIVDILSYVSVRNGDTVSQADDKLSEIVEIVKDSNLNYIENVRDIVEVIRAQVENNLEKLSEDTTGKIDTINNSIEQNTRFIQDDIKKSYNKLLEVQNNFNEIQNTLNVNNISLTANIENVMASAENLKSDFETKLTALKQVLLDKVTDFKQDFTCENADKISELKFNSENLHSKLIQHSNDLKNELRLEIEQIIAKLKTGVAELTEQVAGTTLKLECSNKEIVSCIKNDFASEVDNSVEALNQSIKDFSQDISIKAEDIVNNCKALQGSVDNLSETTTSSLSSTLAKILENFVSLKGLMEHYDEKSSNYLKQNIDKMISEYSELKSKICEFDTNIDEDLTRQISIIENEFESFSSQIETLFNERNVRLEEILNTGLADISAQMNLSLAEKLELYKAAIENSFDTLVNKNDEQSDFIKTKVQELGGILNSSLEVQNQVAEEKLNAITSELKNILSENIKLTAADYEGLKSKISEFSDVISQNNTNLTDGIKAQLDDMTRFVDSGLDLQADEVNAKFDSISSLLQGVSENTAENIAEIRTRIESIVEEISKFKQSVSSDSDENIAKVINKLSEVATGLLEKNDDIISALVKSSSSLNTSIENTNTSWTARSEELQSALTENAKNLANDIRVELTSQNEELQSALTENSKNLASDIRVELTAQSDIVNTSLQATVTNINSSLQDFQNELSVKYEELNSTMQRSSDKVEDAVDALVDGVTAPKEEIISTVVEKNLDLKNSFATLLETKFQVSQDDYEIKFAELKRLMEKMSVQHQDSILTPINRIIEELDANRQNMQEQLSSLHLLIHQDVAPEFEGLYEKYQSLLEEQALNFVTQLGNHNAKLSEDMHIKFNELADAFVTLNERLDKDDISQMNLLQSHLSELSDSFNNLIADVKNVTHSEIELIAAGLKDDNKEIIEEVNQSIEEKFNSVIAANAEMKTEELESVEALVNKLSEQVDAVKSNSQACQDVINDLINQGFSNITKDIEKETDVIVSDIIEQFTLLKDAQSDELSKLSVNIESTLEDYIYNYLNDLKAYLDVKTDNTILNQKLENLHTELGGSLEEALTNIKKMIEANASSKEANEVLITSMTDKLNDQIQNFFIQNREYINQAVVKKLDDKFNLFDKKFIDTLVDKYEEIKLISSKYKNSYDEINTSIHALINDFVSVKNEISGNVVSLVGDINSSIKALNNSFTDLKIQILNKDFDEAFQASINNQIAGIESLVNKQLGYLEDISELCCNNLPELTEMNTIVKYGIQQAISDIAGKLGSSDTNIIDGLNALKADIITQFLNIFNQISFVAEQEEILDFIQEKHSDLITILSHIVTTSDSIETVKDNVAVVDNKIDTLKEDIDLINEKITSIISSEGNIEYVYSLQDLESDIANLRIVLNDMKKSYEAKELGTEEFKKDFESLSEDILSISSRTNKLILASDESYKTLRDNLQDFKLVINDLDERTRNFARESGLDKIDNKLISLNSMIQSGAKTNQVFNQVFEYLAEWVDKAGEQITRISDRVEALDDIGQVKVMLQDLKAEAEDNSDSVELIEALSNVFDKQAKKISSLEAKLDRVIVETTISNKNNKIDMTPFEETLNRFLVAIDEKMIMQQNKIDALEAKLEDVVSKIDPKDTAQLTKKVGGMDRQIAKLNKSIEKIASHVVEK